MRTVRNEDDTEAMKATPERKRAEIQSSNSSGATSSLSKQAAASLQKENEDLNSQLLDLRDELTGLTEGTLQLTKDKKTLKKHWEEELERLESSFSSLCDSLWSFHYTPASRAHSVHYLGDA